MITLFLSLVLALQGVPVQAQQGGTVTGVLKDTQGKPVAGIRMAAIARPESLDEAVTSAAMSSLSETDQDGRYTLENIPPGRYFIAAGRLDSQTYYPGTSDMAAAKEVAMKPGVKLSGIDFALDNVSFGRATSGGNPGILLALPLRITVEGGGRLPLSGAGKITTVKLEMGGSVITAPMTSTVVNVPGPQTTAYRVTVENLPDSYSVKSITYGSTDLLTNTLRLTPPDFARSAEPIGRLMQLMATAGVPLGNGAPQVSPPMPVSTPVGATPAPTQVDAARMAQLMQAQLLSPTSAILQLGALPQDPAGLQAFLSGMAAAMGTPASTLTTLLGSQPGAKPPSLLSITLAPAQPKAKSGVRVSGRTSVAGTRTVYLSGIPGAVYSDGTFDVYGVPPGRHVIVTRDNSSGLSPLAATIVVENRDLEGIVLVETALLPLNSWQPAAPRPAGEHPPGIVPLAHLTGSLVEELSKQPIPEGTVILKTNGYYSASFPVDADGHFELPPLLPGTYDLEVQIFGHSNVKRSIEIDDKDMKLELTSRRLY